MPEGMTNVQIKAHEVSSLLFDDLVSEVLAGETKDVQVAWEDAIGEDGELTQIPRVTIDGQSAHDFVVRPMEYVTTDTEYMESTAALFEQKMGSMWEDTMTYYRELNELGVVMDGLAVSREAGFYYEARTRLLGQGISLEIGDGEVVETARVLACKALAEWADAVDAETTQQ